ncbi:MAG: restriction endonuclease subunit S [Streptococcus sp.]|uniref:Type I restriction endonuclease subunit S n=1 Tax=Streptococcus oralis subsp. oralis TaxID=1891914 RepID=A0A1X1HTP7_STROR|nr:MULTISPECIES: restriction endonuclease subunit S [Streptococcus]MDU5071426.1 restriction endonuclease subunit S [Streptococcus sp.]ORO64266.1 type I restriction endonuclease subunit S [Streptococcus oralis subsp. oralis]
MKKVKLGEVATFINGYAFKPQDWSFEGKEIIRIQNLTKTSKEINYYSGTIDKKYIVEDGDILISWSGTLGVFEWCGKSAVLNQHIFKVVFDKIDIDKSYFKYVVEKGLQDAIKHTHGSTMKHLTKKYFDNIMVSYTNLKEQQRIASELDLLSKLILRRQEQLEEFNILVKSRFNEMFGDPVLNDMGWEIETLDKVGTIGRGVSKYRPRNASELFGGIYPFIQTGDVANSGNYIVDYHSTYSEFGLKQSKLWDKGTLCITIAANIAKTSILAFDSCFPDSIVGFIPGERTNNMFIHYWFSYFQKMLESQAPESAQKNINLKILSELKVILPPLALQNEFADFVAQADKSQLAIQKSLEELETLKKSLMQEYFG